MELELGLGRSVTWILTRNTSRRHPKKLGDSKISYKILPSWEDPSKEVSRTVEAEHMGASEFLTRRLNEELQRAFEAGVPSGASITPSTSHWNPK